MIPVFLGLCPGNDVNDFVWMRHDVSVLIKPSRNVMEWSFFDDVCFFYWSWWSGGELTLEVYSVLPRRHEDFSVVFIAPSADGGELEKLVAEATVITERGESYHYGLF